MYENEAFNASESESETEADALSVAIRKRVTMVELYWSAQKSCNKVRVEWRKRFGTRAELPDNRVIKRAVDKFHGTGSVLNQSKGQSGRSVSATTLSEQIRVDSFVENNPGTSIRRASQILELSRTTFHRICGKLKLKPYKIQTFQELTQFDIDRRDAFSWRILEKIRLGDLDPKKTWFTDEAHFWLSGYVNKQNYRFWGKSKPEVFRTKRTQRIRVTAWIAISAIGVIGPFYFEDNVNGQSYKTMLEEQFLPIAHGLGAVEDFWFMQDGAMPHRTGEVMELLDEHFHGRVIGLGYPSRFGGGLEWPPYSPDLNPCDFFLWGYLKDNVYKDDPLTEEHLIEKIGEQTRGITQETLAAVIKNFEKRLRKVQEKGGEHIEQFLH